MQYIPETNSEFIECGDYVIIKGIIKSREFVPIYLQGPSGVGKTLDVVQACAETGREIVWLSMTPGTTESHLIGGWKLIKGETVFVPGAIPIAMRTGSVLFLDEGDHIPAGVSMIMQSLLQFQPLVIKETGETIVPKSGFTVIVAGNTKGRGDDSGNFAGANVQNFAFLDRFCATFVFTYPSVEQEMKIMRKRVAKLFPKNHDHEFFGDFISSLAHWAKQVREGTNSYIAAESISTRRLLHILTMYGITENKISAIKFAVNGFEESTIAAMLSAYMSVDANHVINTPTEFDVMTTKTVESIDVKSESEDEDFKPW